MQCVFKCTTLFCYYRELHTKNVYEIDTCCDVLQGRIVSGKPFHNLKKVFKALLQKYEQKKC
jgi:hypothetical protein